MHTHTQAYLIHLSVEFFSANRSKETVEYELGGIDQSLLLYLEGQNLASTQEQKSKFLNFYFFSIFYFVSR